jgi:hypothetical protein
MALPYRKWTEEDIKTRNICEEGDYPFRIVNAVIKDTQPGTDKNGQPKLINKMLEIDIEFTDHNGQVRKQKDWIVFIEGMDWKLRHLADSTGLIEFYELGDLDCHHLMKKIGNLSLGIRESEYKGEKRKQNFVKDYIKKTDQSPQYKSDFDTDTIPF